MRVRALLLALFLAAFGELHGAPARAATAGECPSSPARFAQEPKLTLPPDTKISSKTVAFEVDLGSDGRVRGLQMDQSSGDGAVDLAVRQMMQAAAYEPAQTGCIAYSGGFRESYELPLDAAATPPPQTGLNTNCTPYVVAFLIPGARDRKRTGTAVVAVELDAAATQSATPALRKSSGSTLLDAQALHLAKAAQFRFLDSGSCTPQPFTYNLEITFQ